MRIIMVAMAFILSVSLLSIAQADQVRPDLAQAEIPTALIGVPEGFYTVLVDKSLQEISLYNGRSMIMVLPCSTGMNTGDKTMEGDRKTPEGIYFTEEMLDGATLSSIYGWRAYVLDYPNLVDQTRGKDGNGIWIHGRTEPLEYTDTKGCVSMRNSNLKQISPYLHAYYTPIVTMDQIAYTNEEALDHTRIIYEDFIHTWINAWEGRRFNDLNAHYSLHFQDIARGYDLDAYMEYKRRVLGRYDHIAISTDQMNIVECKGYVLACFLMDFAGDHYHSSGVKYVYMEKTPRGPRIINEGFLDPSVSEKWNQQAEEFRARKEKRIYAFLDQWKDAWEQMNLQKMKALYADSFTGRDAFFEGKARHLRDYAFVRVDLRDIQVKRSGIFWDVEATQGFTSDKYHDLGIKHLKIMDSGNGFLIMQEDWEEKYHEP